jgi:hypothetical protein
MKTLSVGLAVMLGLLLTAPLPATAKGGGNHPCSVDARRYCGSKTSLQSYMPSCLTDHMADLTPACQARINQKK